MFTTLKVLPVHTIEPTVLTFEPLLFGTIKTATTMDDCETIRRLRHLRGYKQADMADRLGISTKAYSKLENGQTRLTVDRLR